MANKKAIKEPEYVYRARVLKAFDGDTFTAQVDLGFGNTTTIQFNLSDANAHEVRGESLKEGREAREEVRAKMVGKEIIVRTHKTKIKGRYGAEVFIDGESLGENLIKNGHAKPVKEKNNNKS